MRKIRELLLKGMISFAIVPIALAIGFLPTKGLVMVARADGNAGTFADLQGIIDETEDKGTITLEKDYTAEPEEGHLLIPAGKELTIDLNGHTVDGSARTEDDYDHETGEIRAVLVVGENCVLTLSDNSMDATGEIIGEKGEISKLAMLVYGKCTMNGGTITGKLSVGDIYDIDTGSFTMNGGRITGSQNVYVAERAGFEMTAGEIHIENAGCVINNASHTAGFKMSGGTISGQDVSHVVFVGGSFTMSDGTISGEKVTDCIVFAVDTFIMSGGTVSGSGQNGGVFVEKPLNLKISGSPTITGGICLNSIKTYYDGIPEEESSLITVTGELTNTTPITVIPRAKPKKGSPIVITLGLTENGGPNAVNAFSCGVEGLTFIKKDGELAVAKPEATEWDALQELLAGAGDTVTLDKDYKATVADDTLIIPKSRQVTLDLNGHKIDGSAITGREVFCMFHAPYVDDSTILTIRDGKTGGEILCGTNVGFQYSWFCGYLEFNMQGGTIKGSGTIINGGESSPGGDLFYMSGGAICGWIADGDTLFHRSSLLSINFDDFHMTGGTISGTGYKDIVYLTGAKGKDASDIVGGEIIGSNVENVLELGNSNLIVSGGTITGTNADSIVSLGYQSDFTISGGTIDGSGAENAVAVNDAYTTLPSTIRFAVSGSPTIKGKLALTKDTESVPVTFAGTTNLQDVKFSQAGDITAKIKGGYNDPTLKLNGEVITPSSDGTYTIPVTTDPVTITAQMKTSLTHTDVKYDTATQIYTGEELTIPVTHLGRPLTEGTDYTVTYTKNGEAVSQLKESGLYTATFTGIGDYTDTKAVNITVAGPVYITGVTAKSRVFNGGTDAEVSGTAVLKRVSDDSEVTGLTASDITASFADMNTGSNKAVSITGCTLSEGNYTLDTDKTNEVLALKADITKATMSDPPSQRTKRYLYSRDNADSYPLGLPADCGILSCNTLETTGDAAYDPAPSVSDAGVLSYKVKKGNLGTTGTISINAVMQNYNDVPIIIDIRLVGQLSVKAEDDVTLNNTLTYGQKLSALQFEPVGFVTDDEFEDEVAGTLAWKERDSVPDVQTTSATWVFTPDDPQFYAGCEGTVAITVNKADIPAGDITAPSAETLSYNALEQDLIKAGSVRISTCTMKYYHAAVEDPDNPPSAPDDPDLYSPSIPKATGAGTYYVWYMVDGDDNYNNWTEEKLALKAFITPREVGLKWSDTSFTYDGEEHCPSAYCEGLIYGDKCDVTVTGGAVNANAAGESYTSTAAGLTNNDYKLPENKTVKFRIEKAAGPDAPTGLAGVVPTWDGVSDGKITGVTDAMEYSADLISWTACTGMEVTGLLPGTYHVRVKETGNYEAGKSAAVAVPEPDPEVLELDLEGLPGADGKDVRLSVARSSAPIYYDGKKHVVKDTFLYHYPEERAVEGTGLKDSQKKTTSANILIKVDGLTPMYKVSYVYKDNKNASLEKPYFYLKLALDKKSDQYKALGKKEKSAVSKALSKANKELKKEGNRIKFEILKRDVSTFTHDPDSDTHGKNSAVVFKDAEGNLLTVNLGFTKKKGVTTAKIKNVKMSYVNGTEKPSCKVITEGKKQIARSIVNGEDGTFTISLEGCTTGKNLNYTGVLTYTEQ